MSSVSTLPIIKNVSDRSTDYYGWLGTSGIFCCFKMCYAQIIKVCNFTSYFKLTPLMLLDSMTCRSHFHWTAFYYVLDSRNITLLDFVLLGKCFCLAVAKLKLFKARNLRSWDWPSSRALKERTLDSTLRFRSLQRQLLFWSRRKVHSFTFILTFLNWHLSATI